MLKALITSLKIVMVDIQRGILFNFLQGQAGLTWFPWLLFKFKVEFLLQTESKINE